MEFTKMHLVEMEGGGRRWHLYAGLLEKVVGCWRKLWAVDLPKKCKSFLWIISHIDPLIGKWLQRRGKDGACRSCNYDLESIEHCLWSCMYAHMIWERIICILAACGMEGSISFGYAIWWYLQKNAWMCGAQDCSLALIVHRTHWAWVTIGCTQIGTSKIYLALGNHTIGGLHIRTSKMVLPAPSLALPP